MQNNWAVRRSQWDQLMSWKANLKVMLHEVTKHEVTSLNSLHKEWSVQFIISNSLNHILTGKLHDLVNAFHPRTFWETEKNIKKRHKRATLKRATSLESSKGFVLLCKLQATKHPNQCFGCFCRRALCANSNCRALLGTIWPLSEGDVPHYGMQRHSLNLGDFHGERER